MSGYALSKSAVTKTARVVKQVGSTPLSKSKQSSRRIGAQGISVKSDYSPFQMILDKNILGENIVIINSGIITIENPLGPDISYSIPSGELNINDYDQNTTIYIYTKILSNWGGNNFKGYPDLTIGEINFSQNNIKQPNLDVGHFYYPIGSIDLVLDGDQKKLTIDQSLTTDIFFRSKNIFSFRITQIYSAKTSDTSSDSSFDIFINGGQAMLPDNNVILNTTTDNVPVSSEKFAYLKISATPNISGYWENFNATIVKSSTVLNSDADTVYYLIGTYGSNPIQSFQGDFISDGRVK